MDQLERVNALGRAAATVRLPFARAAAGHSAPRPVCRAIASRAGLFGLLARTDDRR
jgi:hypothetical protein